MGRRLLRIRKRTRTIAIALGLGLAIPVTLALLVGFSLARAAPSWWRQYTLDDKLRARATSVENAAVSMLSKTRPTDPSLQPGDPWKSAPWSIAIRDDDASAWLTARLGNWLASDQGFKDWPEGLGRPQIKFENGQLRLGAMLRFEKGNRVLSAAIEPEFRDDGSLWLRTDWIHIGRLPLPAGPMLARAQSAIDQRMPGDLADNEHAVSLFKILRGDAPLAQHPVLRIDEGRAVRLLALRLLDGHIELDCQTVSQEALARN